MTLRCLAGLMVAALPPGTNLAVYLVDDGSTDGTGDAVAQDFPQVHLLRGDGSLYWGGGMRMAFAAAMKDGHDFYLWLNDDVELFPQAIGKMIEAHQSKSHHGEEPVIIVGACCDSHTKRTTYGGRVHCGWHPLNFELVEPDPEQPVPCETMNGNVVLISHTAAKRTGNLDPRFTQNIGDIDYGLRAGRSGVKLWIAPGYVASCEANIAIPVPYRADRPLLTRLKAVNSPLGRPVREWMLYGWRHGGILGLLASLAGYWRVFWPPRPEPKPQ
jgi:GT2 family glycosyltransferase